MPHINLSNNLPGIASLLKQYPQTAKPMLDLAQVLLRGDSSLSEGERELIATYVSSENECTYCQSTHGATAKHLLEVGYEFIEQVKNGEASLSPKIKKLLAIGGSVQKGGSTVSEDQISEAKQAGASDKEIHDTVLISAAFCMFNRYVDGLATKTPEDESVYDERGAVLARDGYGWQTET